MPSKKITKSNSLPSSHFLTLLDSSNLPSLSATLHTVSSSCKKLKIGDKKQSSCFTYFQLNRTEIVFHRVWSIRYEMSCNQIWWLCQLSLLCLVHRPSVTDISPTCIEVVISTSVWRAHKYAWLQIRCKHYSKLLQNKFQEHKHVDNSQHTSKTSSCTNIK